MRISDWSSDVCSSDLQHVLHDRAQTARARLALLGLDRNRTQCIFADLELHTFHREQPGVLLDQRVLRFLEDRHQRRLIKFRSEEHTSELQSLMRISYSVFCLKKKNNIILI